MACFDPVRAYRQEDGSVSFTENRHSVDAIGLPCGHCVGCSNELKRQKAMRMVHEAKLWPENSFLTLTYNDEHLPVNGTLVPEDLRDFFKRLRRRIEPIKVRYAACGEYGELFGRPHYHVALYNFSFAGDRYRWAAFDGKYPVYRSPLLEKLWTLGDSSLGDLTPESAAYIAGYVHKKMGDVARARVGDRYPEFWRSSNRPGLGAEWVRRFARTDVWPHDRVVYGGIEVKPPRYYDQKLKEYDPDRFEEVVEQRKLRAALQAADNSPERLITKEKVAKAALDFKKRGRI